jgi:hypothetical protein
VIRILLTKYWVLAHLLVTAGTLCFNPTPSAGLALWSALSLLLMVLCLPPVFRGESFWIARQRVASVMRGDAVLWMSLVAVLYVGCQVLNEPRVLEYAPELKRWVFSPPPLSLFPSSINGASGVPLFVGLVTGLSMAVAVRCALPRKQRLVALLGVAALTGVVALFGAIQTFVTGALPTFAWLGGPYDAGALWLLVSCVALGIVGEAFLEAHRRTLIVAFSVACLNLFGVFAFGSAFLVSLATILVVAWCFFALIAVRASGRHPRFVWRCVLLLPPLFAVGLGLILTPGAETLRPELHLSQWGEALERFWAQWGFRASLAMDVFGANPMLGAGPDGFEQSARFFVKGALSWSYWKSGGTALPCDFLRLLTATGMMGTLLLLLPGGAMLGRCLMRWVEYRQSNRRHYSLRYIFIFIGSFIGVVCVLLASLFGTPLHSPATLGVFLLTCACMGGWMPRPR